jgi:hypothetical protein
MHLSENLYRKEVEEGYTHENAQNNKILLAFVRKFIPKASTSGIYTRKYAEKIKPHMPFSENLYQKQVEVGYMHRIIGKKNKILFVFVRKFIPNASRGSLCTFSPV